MNLHPVQENQWRTLQNSAHLIEAVRLKAKRIVSGLATVVKDTEDRGDPKISITSLRDSDVIASVETEFGNGRLRLRWQSNATEFYGQLVFERELLDHLDRKMWEAALTVKVPAEGAWKIGAEATSFAGTQNINEGDRLYVLALSILYVIVNGPSAG